jgi:hypothetical protein
VTPRDYAAEALDRGRDIEDDRDREAEAREAAGCSPCDHGGGVLLHGLDGWDDCGECDGTGYRLHRCRACSAIMLGAECRGCVLAREIAAREEAVDECPF